MRARLLRDNGGDIEADGEVWILHPVWDAGDRKRMARTANHVVRETREAGKLVGYPTAAIAIASNGTGDFLVLRAGSDEVECWEHETGECRAAVVSWS